MLPRHKVLADLPRPRSQLVAAVAQDPDLTSYVQMLEERYDTRAEGDIMNLPSGDELAYELERFLREKGEESEE